VRRVLFLGDVDGREIDKFLQEAEAVGHLVAVRSALLAAVLNRQAGEMDPSTALERLKSLNKGESQTGTINFRYALAEFCDALLSGAHERLNAVTSRSLPSPVQKSLMDSRRDVPRVRWPAPAGYANPMARTAGNCGRPLDRTTWKSTLPVTGTRRHIESCRA
jgi:hypothetical protein